MLRERATELADLPHQFEAHAGVTICSICAQHALDARHVAWERAAAQQPLPAVLLRERGV